MQYPIRFPSGLYDPHPSAPPGIPLACRSPCFHTHSRCLPWGSVQDKVLRVIGRGAAILAAVFTTTKTRNAVTPITRLNQAIRNFQSSSDRFDRSSSCRSSLPTKSVVTPPALAALCYSAAAHSPRQSPKVDASEPPVSSPPPPRPASSPRLVPTPIPIAADRYPALFAPV
jgi:hypothetical protein